MNKEERKKKIAETTKEQIFVSQKGTGKRLLYRGKIEEFKIHEIPMEYLVLNVENGRIASLVKSFEREHSRLNPEKPDDSKILSQFLLEAHEKANSRTRDDLAKNGQLEPGIITSDGVLVDGNRRFSLMWAILHDDKSTPDEKARCSTFRAVVLPEDADEKEILRLETSFQMGSDEKVGYNPIEKYLHARDMKEQGFSIHEIAEYMGLDKDGDATELLEIMELIDEYLEWCECGGIYTRLMRGIEDDLLKLNLACKKLRRGDIGWIPTDELESVENDLKGVCFDYIRLNMKSEDGFEFRKISSSSGNNFLINEQVWRQFIDGWTNAIAEVNEESVDEVLARSNNVNDSKRLLDNRDNKWRDQVKDALKETFTTASAIVDDKKEKDKPGILIKRAANTLKEVNLNALQSVKGQDEIRNNLNAIRSEVAKIEATLNQTAIWEN